MLMPFDPTYIMRKLVGGTPDTTFITFMFIYQFLTISIFPNQPTSGEAILCFFVFSYNIRYYIYGHI